MRTWNKYQVPCEKLKFSRTQSTKKVMWKLYFKDYSNFVIYTANILEDTERYFRFFNSSLYEISPEEYAEFTKAKLFNFASAFNCLEQHTDNCILYSIENLKRKDKAVYVLAEDDYLTDLGLKLNYEGPMFHQILNSVQGILERHKDQVKKSLYREYLDNGFVNLSNPVIQRHTNFMVYGDFLYTKKDTFTIFNIKDKIIEGKVVERDYICENNIVVKSQMKNNKLVAKTVKLGSKVISLSPVEKVFDLLQEKKVIS